jgi:hypothetical protein
VTPKSKEYVEDSDTDSEPEQEEAARSKPKPPSPIAKRKSNTTFNSPPKKVPAPTSQTPNTLFVLQNIFWQPVLKIFGGISKFRFFVTVL